MCKQRLVLDLRLPALTGKIGIIHSKQGSSELSSLITHYTSPFLDSSLFLDPLPVTRYLSQVLDSLPITRHPSQVLSYVTHH